MFQHFSSKSFGSWFFLSLMLLACLQKPINRPAQQCAPMGRQKKSGPVSTACIGSEERCGWISRYGIKGSSSSLRSCEANTTKGQLSPGLVFAKRCEFLLGRLRGVGVALSWVKAVFRGWPKLPFSNLHCHVASKGHLRRPLSRWELPFSQWRAYANLRRASVLTLRAYATLGPGQRDGRWAQLLALHLVSGVARGIRIQ